ncbi:CoA pyrophosphatase [Microbacterium protaetiae]|uniref:CoA pyrophosphatase n=1 Tax=Microbacterium protaetiae TaxID=2509458 RepID=A0A4P6EBN2_9MICO|nr:CoA pyrophosphatase [Microbacterium protaetiae]QAY59610.1 CoA pyrophosphatase [Microbacterium protaetiae]
MSDAPDDARAALSALAAPDHWPRFDRVRVDAATGRRSAVLMLFGAADGSDGERPIAPDDAAVLLLRRASSLRHHPGQIGFPGGGLEDGDDGPVGAAVREAVEETGIDPRGVELFSPLPELPLAVSNNLVTPVPAWWRHPSPVWAVDAAETEEVFLAPVGELLDPQNRRSVARVRGMRIPAMPAFQLGERLIWGFTGVVLSGLFDTLGWTRPWDAGRLVEPDA